MQPSKLMRVSGIVLLVGGVLALVAPLAASFAVTLIVGWAFVVGGAVNLWSAFQSAVDRLPHLLFGLLGLALGVSFLADPLRGLLSLTVLAGVLFLVSGLVRLWLAWQGRQGAAFWVLLLSGALSVLLGALILGNIGGAVAVLGILLGIELISAGIGLIALAQMASDGEDG